MAADSKTTNDRDEKRRLFASELIQIVPTGQVLHSDEDLTPYESDGLTIFKAKPLAVVLPSSIEEVQGVLKWAVKRSVPVVARGAGTGLSGGALPHEDGILLGLAKFNSIVELNAEHGYAKVQPRCGRILPARLFSSL